MAQGDRIEVLIAQALDDLDEGRLEVHAALRLVARAAWEDGYVHGGSPAVHRRLN
jgi:hypothetical protein